MCEVVPVHYQIDQKCYLSIALPNFVILTSFATTTTAIIVMSERAKILKIIVSYFNKQNICFLAPLKILLRVDTQRNANSFL